jgi:hypothetical protein
MAAVATVVTLGAGDLNSAQFQIELENKGFLVFFFFHLLQDGIVCQPTDGFFYIFFIPNKVIRL